MIENREHEIWAVALWVEQHHAGEGPHFIADQIGRCQLAGDEDGKAIWLKVAERYEALLPVSELGCGRQ